MIELRGITWNHTRGYLPMVATAQRFSERHPEVSIRWEKRSLQQFADQSVTELAASYDLLVIDHPSIGEAAREGALLPLDDFLSREFLADQAANSVGRSHESYCLSGHQWALATDAAAPVSGWRPDLLDAAGASPPKTWMELMELAHRGMVALAGIPIDSLCNFYMLCIGLGEEPFRVPGRIVSRDTGVRALELLRGLLEAAAAGCSKRNPIAVWELLTATGTAAYCPFAYGYSNYGRRSYAAHPLAYGGLPEIEGHARCRSTLGGAGLAVSARCRERGTAVEYAAFTAAPESQSGLYFEAGGQPGHRSAWNSAEVNRAANGFFQDTLATLDEAWLRPRWHGYLEFQDRAGEEVFRYLWQNGDAGETLARLDLLLTAARAPEDL